MSINIYTFFVMACRKINLVVSDVLFSSLCNRQLWSGMHLSACLSNLYFLTSTSCSLFLQIADTWCISGERMENNANKRRVERSVGYACVRMAIWIIAFFFFFFLMQEAGRRLQHFTNDRRLRQRKNKAISQTRSKNENPWQYILHSWESNSSARAAKS